MNFKALLTGGVIVGILGFVSTILSAAGHPVAGAFVGSPDTATQVQHVIDGVMYLISGFSAGVGGAGVAASTSTPAK